MEATLMDIAAKSFTIREIVHHEGGGRDHERRQVPESELLAILSTL